MRIKLRADGTSHKWAPNPVCSKRLLILAVARFFLISRCTRRAHAAL